MKLKTILASVAFSMLLFSCNKQDTVQKTELTKPTKDEDKFSYTIGYDIGRNIQPMTEDSVTLNMDYLYRGLADALKGKDSTGASAAASLLTQEEMMTAMQDFQIKMQAKQQAKMEERKKKYEERSKTAQADGEKFLAENKSKTGVKTTKSGMQYVISKEGNGAIPKFSDRVKLQIVGKFLDGEEFQNTYKMEMVPEISLKELSLKGWQEAITMMPVGSKWTIYLSPSLAYGDQDTGVVPPNSVVIFEIELIDIMPPTPTPTPPTASK